MEQNICYFEYIMKHVFWNMVPNVVILTLILSVLSLYM